MHKSSVFVLCACVCGCERHTHTIADQPKKKISSTFCLFHILNVSHSFAGLAMQSGHKRRLLWRYNTAIVQISRTRREWYSRLATNLRSTSTFIIHKIGRRPNQSSAVAYIAIERLSCANGMFSRSRAHKPPLLSFRVCTFRSVGTTTTTKAHGSFLVSL